MIWLWKAVKELLNLLLRGYLLLLVADSLNSVTKKLVEVFAWGLPFLFMFIFTERPYRAVSNPKP